MNSKSEFSIFVPCSRLVDTNVPRVESDASSRVSHVPLDVKRPRCTVTSKGGTGKLGSRIGSVSNDLFRSERSPYDIVIFFQRPRCSHAVVVRFVTIVLVRDSSRDRSNVNDD